MRAFKCVAALKGGRGATMWPVHGRQCGVCVAVGSVQIIMVACASNGRRVHECKSRRTHGPRLSHHARAHARYMCSGRVCLEGSAKMTQTKHRATSPRAVLAALSTSAPSPPLVLHKRSNDARAAHLPKRRRLSPPALPQDVWHQIAHHLPLHDAVSLSRVSRVHHRALHNLPILALLHALRLPRTLRAAPFILATATHLASVAAEPHGGAHAALRALVGLPSAPPPTLARETALHVTGLSPSELPRRAYIPRGRAACCVTHATYAPPHALGARAACSLVYALDDLLRALARRRRDFERVCAHARVARSQLDARARRAAAERRVLAAAHLPADAAYAAALPVARAALAGDCDAPPLRSTLAGALEVHRRLGVEFRWLLARDGHARSRAAVVLPKALARTSDADRAARMLEKALWWAESPQNLRSLCIRLANVGQHS